MRAEVRGSKVVVVDDIATSFATLNEVRSVLMSAGATEVIPMAIGFHPRKLDAGPATTYPVCEACGHKCVPRFRTDNGLPFFACGDLDAYKRGVKHPPINFRDAFERAVKVG